MSFSGKKKWSLSSSHVTNGKTEVHSSGHDTIKSVPKALCSLELVGIKEGGLNYCISASFLFLRLVR